MKRVIVLLLLALVSSGVIAQSYPAKPVRLIVADAAGGAPDQLGRILAQKLSESLGQQVIVDNRPGAAGVLGADIASKAPADGYTLLLTTTSIYAILPSLKKNLPYDPVKDFAPVSRIATASNVLVVNIVAAGDLGRGAGAAREEQARRAQLRLGRHRLAGAPRRRDAEPARRHQADARSLQGRRARVARRHRRQCAADHHLADRRRRAHERRPRARARHDRRRAQPAPARAADDRRHRAGLRDLAVVGHRGAGRHAGAGGRSG